MDFLAPSVWKCGIFAHFDRIMRTSASLVENLSFLLQLFFGSTFSWQIANIRNKSVFRIVAWKNTLCDVMRCLRKEHENTSFQCCESYALHILFLQKKLYHVIRQFLPILCRLFHRMTKFGTKFVMVHVCTFQTV